MAMSYIHVSSSTAAIQEKRFFCFCFNALSKLSAFVCKLTECGVQCCEQFS